MKKPFLIMIPLLIAGFAFLSFSGSTITGGIVFPSSDQTYPYSAEAEITDEKGRTHQFTVYSDGRRTLLTGNFNLDNQEYPGKILYNGEKSYVFKPGPNQAIYYNDKAQLIYGYLPTNSLDANPRYEVTVLESSQGLATKYEILDTVKQEQSTVRMKNIIHSPAAIWGIEFSLPEDTRYVNAETVLKVG